MSPSQQPLEGGRPEHPTAVVRPTTANRLHRLSRWWWLTAGCAVVAILLVWYANRSRGPRIWVRFQQGHGIQAGDRMRYRGIEIGEVISVEMTRSLDSITVGIQLDPASSGLAREGSRFWIERPQVSLSRVRGLETVVGPKYIAIAPGPAEAPKRRVFEGDENPVNVTEARIEEIVIHFANGHGLAIGDELRHRGIVVGEVTAVDLDEQLGSVTVRVRLAQSASDLARVGSRFWIERPRISFEGVGGLDTIVGGRYLAVQPAASDAEPLDEFIGLDNPPVAIDRAPGGLEIVLDSPHRYGIEAGAPVTHRGVDIGTILSVELAGDAASVELRAYIDPEYRSLVRDNTRFWSTSGIDVNIGVSGLQVNADTLATIAAGGVALATPETAGRLVSTGHRYPLLRRAEDQEEWNEWQPRLAVGAAQLPAGAAVPRVLRGRFKWYKRTLGIRRQQETDGWLLAIDDGRLIAPANMLTVPENIEGRQGVLELVGQEFAIAADKVSRFGDLAVSRVDLPESFSELRWPADSLRAAEQVEDALLVGGTRGLSTPLPAARLKADKGAWLIDAAVPIDADLHGAAVVATSDGKVIGLLNVTEDDRYVVPVSAELLKAES